MKASAASKGAPQSICVWPKLHSTPVKAPDQPRPNTICAIRKAAQSPRRLAGSLVLTKSQL